MRTTTKSVLKVNHNYTKRTILVRKDLKLDEHKFNSELKVNSNKRMLNEFDKIHVCLIIIAIF